MLRFTNKMTQLASSMMKSKKTVSAAAVITVTGVTASLFKTTMQPVKPANQPVQPIFDIQRRYDTHGQRTR